MPHTGLPLHLRHALEALDIALDERDKHTREHCNRLVPLSEATGKRCGLGADQLHTVMCAALFHDIGKIGIPDNVLLKNSNLSPDEWETIKTHSVKGERIIGKLDIDKGRDIAYLIRHHHEHFNGNGYPDGLTGEAIPIGARIISVVDSYDAMTSTRSYARARSHEEVLEIMFGEEGAKSDPYVFRHFLKVVGNGVAR